MPRPESNTTSPTAEANIYQFTSESNQDWRVEDDTVMGGRSDGSFEVTEEGNGRFHGEVSLENNGGFSSVQYYPDAPISVKEHSSFQIRLKGDGKNYNFRVETTENVRYSYTFEFPTKAGQWETISIPFDAMHATFRGRKPDVPNYAGQDVTQLRFLIGNKKEESFELLIDAIEVL